MILKLFYSVFSLFFEHSSSGSPFEDYISRNETVLSLAETANRVSRKFQVHFTADFLMSNEQLESKSR